jgi:hypothetical protein
VAGTFHGVPDDHLGMEVTVSVAPAGSVPAGQEQYSR